MFAAAVRVSTPSFSKTCIEMLVHGTRTGAEYLADIAVGFALDDPEQHFGLAQCEAKQGNQPGDQSLVVDAFRGLQRFLQLPRGAQMGSDARQRRLAVGGRQYLVAGLVQRIAW